MRALKITIAAWTLAVAGPSLGADDSGGEVILDTMGSWRLHHTLKPPVIQLDAGLKPVLMSQPWLNLATPEPPAGWRVPDFDDGAWVRSLAGKACRTSYLSRLCMRGRFRVTDPAKVAGLRLSVDYHGGVVVYVNGHELTRAHLPAGPLGAEALADGYPEQAFVTETDGLLVPQGYYLPAGRGRAGRPSAESVRRMGLRKRGLSDVAVPARLLRKGVNVLAIEVIRAPYHKVLDRIKRVVAKRSSYDFRSEYDLAWNTCQILRVRLTADGEAGLVPNATRPKGMQVWNSNALKADYDMDWGDPCERLRPVRLVGARNGRYSGKVVVGSTSAIRDLSAVAGELTGPAGTIPASAVRVRYGVQWGVQAGLGGLHGGNPYPRDAVLLEAVADAPLKEFPVPNKPVRSHYASISPSPVLGAVVPVWVTVKVPASAPAGAYAGEIVIRARGEKPVTVPVDLTVIDWTLPDAADYRTWVDMIQSPDTLALEYGLKRWSDRHWDMIARSFQLMGEVGNKTLYVPLIAHTNLGNDESMVRWIETARGRPEFDFSIMDRYVDTALKHMGRPELVVLNVWDLYLIPSADGLSDAQAVRAGKRKRHTRMAINLAAHGGKYGLGPLVTVLDPATGKTENKYLPTYGETPVSKEMWGALFRELRSHMRQRGLDKALILGMLSDAWPSKQDVQFFQAVAPGLEWMLHSHDGHPPDKSLHGLVPVSYQSQVWGVRFADATPYKYQPVKGRMYGWNRDKRLTLFERFPNTDTFPATKWRSTGEYTITGDRRGIGRLGADFWRVVKDKRGGRVGRAPARFPEAHWRNLNVCTSLLAPGPAGPASTNRYEHFREGIQECEARIAIERALLDESLARQLGPELAKRCQDELDRRLLLIWKGMSSLQLNGREFGYATGWRWTQGVDGHRWFIGSGWQDRSRELYSLASQVAAKLGRSRSR